MLLCPPQTFCLITMVALSASGGDCVSSSLPARPTADELLSWLDKSDFSTYKDEMQSALERQVLIAEDIRSMTAKMLLDELSLPNFGTALHMLWALHLSEVSDNDKHSLSVSLAKLDEKDIAQWLESENLLTLSGLFVEQGMTGKAVVVLQAKDLTDMGFTDFKEIESFFKARETLLGNTDEELVSAKPSEHNAGPELSKEGVPVPLPPATPPIGMAPMTPIGMAPMTPEKLTAGNEKRKCNSTTAVSNNPWKRAREAPVLCCCACSQYK